LIYFFTAPFLWPFQGLLYTPTFGGVPVEFPALIAIIVYTLIAWIITRFIWLLFSRTGKNRTSPWISWGISQRKISGF
jgi:hypothetical protein